jgi:hypothetical protein
MIDPRRFPLRCSRRIADLHFRRASVPAVLSAFALCAARLACAADGPHAPETDLDEVAQVRTPLEVDQSSDPAQLIEQTVELMRAAQKRFAGNQLDDETAQLQRQIQEQLARLLKLSEQRAAQRPQFSPDEPPLEPPAPRSSPAGGRGDQQSQSSRAGESSEQPSGGEELTDVEIQRRKDVATAVWGHLPPRLRDRMHGAFSGRFLPPYDELVRRYYEALATQGRDSEP